MSYLEPEIIYEDDNVLVIDKPVGLAVHPDGYREEITLIDWLLKKYPKIAEVGEAMKLPNGAEVHRPGIVHRLDRDTSGVMIIAKNQSTFLFLKEQFQNRTTCKIYRAILSGTLKLSVGEEKILDWPIGRSRQDPRRRVANLKARGLLRPATTIFRLLANLGGSYSYVEAEPKTGRTHQLRAHFKAYQHPIIGDALYNPKDNGGEAIRRQALHAYQLTINLPHGEKGTTVLTKTFTAPLPADFESALEKLKSSC